jgi:glutamate--cysteine ligase
VARYGRARGLALTRDGRQVQMRSWAAELLESMQGVCELLDATHPQRPYSVTLKEQQAKLEDVDQTPSARLLRDLRESGESFTALVLRMSRSHKEYMLAFPRNEARWRQFEAEAEESLEAQRSLEAAQRGSFEEYLAAYLAG